jgi:hypothetical protein
MLANSTLQPLEQGRHRSSLTGNFKLTILNFSLGLSSGRRQIIFKFSNFQFSKPKIIKSIKEITI